jgi:ABC-type uncharacterized transport system substrate-binding protein
MTPRVVNLLDHAHGSIFASDTAVKVAAGTSAEVGGLMAYGPSWPHLWQRAAAHVDKILKGARPADLPVERPMKLDLVLLPVTSSPGSLSLLSHGHFDGHALGRAIGNEVE